MAVLYFLLIVVMNHILLGEAQSDNHGQPDLSGQSGRNQTVSNGNTDSQNTTFHDFTTSTENVSTQSYFHGITNNKDYGWSTKQTGQLDQEVNGGIGGSVAGHSDQYVQPGQSGQPGQYGNSSQLGQPGQSGHSGQPGQSGQVGQSGQPGQYGHSGQPGQPVQSGHSGQPGHSGQAGQSGQHGQYGHSDQPGQPGQYGHYGQPGQSGQHIQHGQPGQTVQTDQSTLHDFRDRLMHHADKHSACSSLNKNNSYWLTFFFIHLISILLINKY